MTVLYAINALKRMDELGVRQCDINEAMACGSERKYDPPFLGKAHRHLEVVYVTSGSAYIITVVQQRGRE